MPGQSDLIFAVVLTLPGLDFFQGFSNPACRLARACVRNEVSAINIVNAQSSRSDDAAMTVVGKEKTFDPFEMIDNFLEMIVDNSVVITNLFEMKVDALEIKDASYKFVFEEATLRMGHVGVELRMVLETPLSFRTQREN